MKKITTKLSNLFSVFNVAEYEKEFDISQEEVFIKNHEGDYVKVNHLIKKRSNMISMKIENIENEFVCSDKHQLLTKDGFKLATDTTSVINTDGEILKVIEVKHLGEGDAFDVSLDAPHVYSTPNKLIHHNTFVALYKALEEVLDKSNPFNKIIIVRSAVPSREVGHLPGDLNEKTDIYRQPYQQICQTLFGRPDAYQRLEEQHHIEFISTSFIRGMSFDDAIIIVDEMQNCNYAELQTVITRVGHRSKIIFCGDYRQTDLLKNKNDVSGIKKFLDIASRMKCHTRIEFTADDIVRSSLVKEWIIAETNFNDEEHEKTLLK